MGLSDLEARFLSAKAGPEEVPESLRDPTQYRRSEFYFPPTGQRIDHSELAPRYATPFSFRRKGPSGHHSHQAAQRDGRLRPTIFGDYRALGRRGKLGPVLFQLPPNLKADAALLKDFLAILPRNVPAAFEFRHASWFSDATWDLLKSSNVALCVAETEAMTTPEVATGGFIYYRFRKPNYTEEERRSMIDRIGQHVAAGRDVFAYFKHEETPEGALYAVNLLRALQET